MEVRFFFILRFLLLKTMLLRIELLGQSLFPLVVICKRLLLTNGGLTSQNPRGEPWAPWLVQIEVPAPVRVLPSGPYRVELGYPVALEAHTVANRAGGDAVEIAAIVLRLDY